MNITMLSRHVRATVPVGGGGGGGSFPYGAAALPTGMSWNYTEGGTREVTGSPLSFSYASVPTVTGTTYDVSSTATWSTAVASAVDGDGIRITADFSTTGLANLSRTTSSGGFVLVFTDLKATLDTDVPYSSNYLTCTKTNRIETTDTTAFRTITMTGGSTTPLLGCAQSAVGYWFCGIKFTRNNEANESILDFGNSVMTQESHMPNRMVLDRCIVDAAELSKRAISLNSKDTLISGSQLINATSSPQVMSLTDSQAIAIWSGGKDLLIYNTAMSAESECFATGAAQGDIANPFIPGTNVALIRNHIFKPAAWDSDATYPLKKNHFETKSGDKMLLFGNVFDRFRSSSGGQFHAIILKAEVIDSTHPWMYTRDVNIVGNLSINQTEGGILNISLPGSNGTDHLGIARVTVVHLYQRDGSSDSSSEISISQGPLHKDFPDYHFEHNTVHCKDVWLVMDGSINGGTFARCVIRNNANAKAPDFGPVFSSDGTNTTVLDNQMGAGNWIHAKNAQVSGGASWGATLLGSPHNNLQDTLANMFTDSGTADYSAKAAGPLDGTATDGFDIGADVPWVLSLTTGVV